MTSLLEDPAWDMRIEFDRRTFCFSSCKRKLAVESQREIVESLHLDMGGADVREYFARQPSIFSDYDLLVLALSQPAGVPIALLGGRWHEMDALKILYIWTIFIVETHRRSRLLQDMLATLGGAGLDVFPQLIALKTYSPRVYQIVARFARAPGFKLYPNIPSDTQDPEMVALSKRAMSTMFPALRFSAESGLVVGGQASVGMGVFPEMPRVANTDIMQHFERHLSPADQLFVLLKPPAEQLGMSPELFCRALSPGISQALASRSRSVAQGL